MDSEGPLIAATRCGNVEAVNLLLACGADFNDDDLWGVTALHTAAESPLGTDMVRTLLDDGANYKHKSKSNTTALWYAVAGCNLETVNLLLEHGSTDSLKISENGSLTDIHDLLLENSDNMRNLLHLCMKRAEN